MQPTYLITISMHLLCLSVQKSKSGNIINFIALMPIRLSKPTWMISRKANTHFWAKAPLKYHISLNPITTVIKIQRKYNVNLKRKVKK